MTAFTQAQYQTLVAMIAKGVTTLKLGNGEEVTYRSLDEMLRLKTLMEDGLGLSPRARGGLHAPIFSRGGR